MHVKHLTLEELEAGLDRIRQSPRDSGVLELIVRRPGVGTREALTHGALDPAAGLAGDSWSVRGGFRKQQSPNPDTQINVMNSRVIALLAQDRSRWPLAGDQLYVDLDLSVANVPPGMRLALGHAIIEVTAEPHTGCGKFITRFGMDAAKFVNSALGRQMQLRGINARVVQAGAIRVGDMVRKIATRQV